MASIHPGSAGPAPSDQGLTNHLAGPRVRLDATTSEDAVQVALWHRDGVFLRHLDAEPASPTTADTLVDRWRAIRAAGGFPCAVRTLGAEPQLVGLVALDEVLWPQRGGWLAMEIDPHQWGQGYGREALSLLLRFAFDELNLRRLSLTVFSYNARAIRLYEGFGFQREGAFREFLVRDGQPYDMLLYGLLEREWRAGGHA